MTNHDYSFFLFSMLVNDTIIKENKMSIPYDILFDIVKDAHEKFKENDKNFQNGEYEEIVTFLENNDELINQLKIVDEFDC